MKDAGVLKLIIITIGGSIVMKGIAMFIWGKETYLLPHFSGETPIPLGSATILPQTLWILGIMGVTVTLLTLFFRYTLLGKAMRACSATGWPRFWWEWMCGAWCFSLLCERWDRRDRWDHYCAHFDDGLQPWIHAGFERIQRRRFGGLGKQHWRGDRGFYDRHFRITRRRIDFFRLQRRDRIARIAYHLVRASQRPIRKPGRVETEIILAE